MIFKQIGPVNYAFFGNSRMMEAVDAYLFDDYIEEKTGESVVVYEFARSWRSQEHMYILVRDFLERRVVKNLILEYNVAPSGARNHPYTVITGKLSDLFEACWVDTYLTLPRRMSQFSNWILERQVFHLEQRITGQTKSLANIPIGQAVTEDCTKSETLSRFWNVQSREKSRGDYWKKNDMDWDFNRLQEVKLNYYTQKIINMATERGVNVTLVHFPETYYGPLSDKLANAIRKNFKVPLVNENRELLAELFSHNIWADNTHFTPEGRKIFSKWFFNQL